MSNSWAAVLYALQSDSSQSNFTFSDQSTAFTNLWDLIRIQLQLTSRSHNSTIECNSRINIIRAYEYAIIPAALMIILGCVSQRRKRLWQNVCDARPGLAHPMNILEDRSVRFSYALGFGIAAQLCHGLLFGDSDLYKQHVTSRPDGQFKFLHVVYRIAEVCMYCIIMFPIFLTITKRNRIFYAAGTIYIWAFTIVNVMWLVLLNCPQLLLQSRLIITLKYLPSLICMLGLSIIFPYRLLQLLSGNNASMRVTRNEYVYQFEYVRDLINVTQDINLGSGSAIEKLKHQLRSIQYTRRNGFRYSARVICTYTAVLIVVYMVTYGMVHEVTYWIKLVHDILDLLESIIKAIIIGTDALQKQLDNARVYVGVFSTCFTISVSLMIALNLANIVMMVLNYRENILQIYRGDYSGYPSREEKASQPNFLVAANIKYGGYQIAFTGVAMAMQLLLAMIVSLLMSTILFDPVQGQLRDWFVEFLAFYWPLAIISGSVLLVQYLLVRYLFIDKESTNGKIAINHRNLYFTWAYLMFYFNVFWGLVTGTVRLLKAVTLTICFFNRLDWCILPKRFEAIDEAYFSYVGMLYTENAHTNPVLRTFLSLVSQQAGVRQQRADTGSLFTRGRRSSSIGSIVGEFQSNREKQSRVMSLTPLTAESLGAAAFSQTDSVQSTVARSRRSRTRWHLAITLSNNPALRQLRWHHLSRIREGRLRPSAAAAT